MADKNLRYFMRPEAKEEKIVEVPGPSAIKGEDGKPITMKVKVLHNKRIREINDSYRTRRMATDKKGNPMVANGEVVFKVEKDGARAARHLIAEALVFPDMRDKELQDFFKCYDMVDMVDAVFPSADEYAHVSNVVLAALGLGPAVDEADESDDDKQINDAKN